MNHHGMPPKEVSCALLADTKIRCRSATTLFRLAVVMQAGSRCLCAAAKRWDAWLQRRRVTAATLHDFGTMSEHELHDIGLIRVGVHRVARSASLEIHNPI